MADELNLEAISDYAAGQLSANPENYKGLTTWEPDFEADLSCIFEDSNFESVQSKLRQYRHRVMVWIILQDQEESSCQHDEFLGAPERHPDDAKHPSGSMPRVIKTCTYLSDFAETCIRHTVQYCASKDLITVAFGKLGGRELNFSSDVDLMFVGDLDEHRRGILKIVKMLSEKTADGFVFRVDLRLRPFGDSGPLCLSAAQCLKYYQEHGREWERYAWIKARVITGDANQLKFMSGFVYRPYIDFSSLAGLRSIKSQIDMASKKRGYQNHIKLGSGGIRELEFIVQSFQLIHGGKKKSLRETNFIAALCTAETLRLCENAPDLKRAYLFLRDLENKLQMVGDQQTHELPVSSAHLDRIALAMKLDSKMLLDKLVKVRGVVQRSFQQLAFRGQVSEVDIKHEESFLNSDKTRWYEFLKEIQKRKPYLSLLRENTFLEERISTIFNQSEVIFNRLKQHPFLLSVFLHSRQNFSHSALTKVLCERMSELDAGDIESKLDCLREFKLEIELGIMLSDLESDLPLMKVSDALTALAEVILAQVLFEVKSEMKLEIDFAVVAYGKLGGLELSYTSDLDVVFIYQNGHQKTAVRLGQKILSWIQTRTYRGTLYEMDMRLRPDGVSGMLVSTMDSFAAYQTEKAWTWEHQALLRARMVVGPGVLKKQFNACRQKVLQQKRDIGKLEAEVCEMREKMRESIKHDKVKNALVDIEFQVQLLALSYASQYLELVEYSDNIRILAAAASCGVIDESESQKLIERYIELRSNMHDEFLKGEL